MERALARTYDPERWLRRWAFGIGALLLAGFFLPIYDPLWAEGWTWPWERTLSLLSKLDVFTPPVVGLVTIVAALTKSASLRLWLLIAAFTLVAVFAAEWVFTPFAGVRGARVVLQIGLLTSALFIAAANHLRRRHPDRGEFRRILLPIGILVAGLSLLQKYFEPTSRAQPEAAAGVLRWADHLQSSITGYVVAYGVLTAAHARADGRVVFRSRLLAWLTRAFFPFQALVLVLSFGLQRLAHSTDPSVRPLSAHGAEVLRHLVLSGQPALCALALAAWAERHGIGPKAQKEIHVA
jgi:hypothetical protein